MKEKSVFTHIDVKKVFIIQTGWSQLFLQSCIVDDLKPIVKFRTFWQSGPLPFRNRIQLHFSRGYLPSYFRPISRCPHNSICYDSARGPILIHEIPLRFPPRSYWLLRWWDLLCVEPTRHTAQLVNYDIYSEDGPPLNKRFERLVPGVNQAIYT